MRERRAAFFAARSVTVTATRDNDLRIGDRLRRAGVTERKKHNYPVKCAFRLDERDGRLYYAEHEIGPVPPPWRPGLTWAIASPETRGRLSKAIGPRWDFQGIYRCRQCNHWAAGSGFTWCSPECRLQGAAKRLRDYRAAQAKKRADRAVCTECGAPMQAMRRTRKFCSDRCRQAAHRKGVAIATVHAP